MSDERDFDVEEDEAWAAEWADLRAAWLRLPAPEPAGELAAADAETRAAVAWMCAAWDVVAIPASVPLLAAGPSRVHTVRPRRSRLVLPASLAAAGLLLFALAGLWLFGSGRLAGSDAPIVRVAGGLPRPDPSTRKAAALRVAAVDAERIELRSGPVRLLLITAGSSGPDAVRR